MTNNEIRYKFYLPDTKFYGTMYGNKYIGNELDKIIKIDKKEISFAKNIDAFYYVWGWPGPDANLYYFKDYGITWAFDMNDFDEPRECINENWR